MLHIQSAGVSDNSALEQILLQSNGALRGGGMFAWATRSGVASLISDPIFQKFLDEGEFSLIVGLDSITDEAAIAKLASVQKEKASLNVKLFLNPSPGLFHPKMVWFEFADHLTLIVGSGNLTMGGMLSNWEAFVVTKESGADAAHDIEAINSWLLVHRSELVSVDNPRALELAKLNSGNERTLRLPVAPAPEAIAANEADSVLVAEFPRSGGRPSQVNFDLGSYTNFFGAAAGTQRRIILYSVSSAAILGPMESRPSVEVASHNYRFELRDASQQYPADGPPIGVFLRLKTGEFLYEVVRPGGDGYLKLDEFLADNWSGHERLMRRVATSVSDLSAHWPEAPVLHAVVPQSKIIDS